MASCALSKTCVHGPSQLQAPPGAGRAAVALLADLRWNAALDCLYPAKPRLNYPPAAAPSEIELAPSNAISVATAPRESINGPVRYSLLFTGCCRAITSGAFTDAAYQQPLNLSNLQTDGYIFQEEKSYFVSMSVAYKLNVSRNIFLINFCHKMLCLHSEQLEIQIYLLAGMCSYCGRDII
ncbi:unnamed protein product [Trichogramma brassicae]|uniref:Uncharacterized protein n=1 Tax=Trichogramma brassicae TaxID=86971 RepID=A0A6H5IXG7_9HYME|nr:unnamed protein product [Trichogramma brassicae]